MKVYADYNATAPIRPEVRAALEPLLFGAPETGVHGNASSIHWAGREARKHLEAARRRVAAAIGRKSGEIVFTSGGTEADNLALRGVFGSNRRPRRLLLSAVEHPAVFETARHLAAEGIDTGVVPVDSNGALDLEILAAELARPTGLVSCMAVNNETGIIHPIERVSALAHAAGALLHVDAVQGAGRIALPPGVDLMTLSGHKLGGPKGVGVLIIGDGIALEPELSGGPQERGRRAGTESVALAVGLAVALEQALADRNAEVARLGALRDRLEEGLLALDGVEILGAGGPRIASTTTALFTGIEGDAFLQGLDLAGIAASSGSACASGSLEPSHVLLAMGRPAARALGAVRFSFGWASRAEEIDRILETVPDVLRQARAAYTG